VSFTWRFSDWTCNVGAYETSVSIRGRVKVSGQNCSDECLVILKHSVLEALITNYPRTYALKDCVPVFEGAIAGRRIVDTPNRAVIRTSGLSVDEVFLFHAARKKGLRVRCVDINSHVIFCLSCMWLRRMHMATASNLLQLVGCILRVVQRIYKACCPPEVNTTGV
jgi:hypothetical protein